MPVSPHYFIPLEDGHLKDLSKTKILRHSAIYTYLVADRTRGAIRRNASPLKPVLTKDDWFTDSWRVYLHLDEAKRFGDLLYQTRRSVRIFTCPTVMFQTDDHYILVLDLNTRTPFSTFYEMFKDGRAYPRTVGGVGRLLSAAKKKQDDPPRLYLTGVVSREQFSIEGLQFDEATKPYCLGYSRSYVPATRGKGGRWTVAKVAARLDAAKWLPQIWDVSEEYCRQL